MVILQSKEVLHRILKMENKTKEKTSFHMIYLKLNMNSFK